MENTNTGTCVVTRRRTRKDGTVREYVYAETYEKKTNRIHCGKDKLVERLRACNDRNQLSMLADLLTEFGL